MAKIHFKKHCVGRATSGPVLQKLERRRDLDGAQLLVQEKTETGAQELPLNPIASLSV
jgi:hypothetical protein